MKNLSKYSSLGWSRSPRETVSGPQPALTDISSQFSKNFLRLPAEILLQILEQLRPQDFVNFALVHYTLLWNHRIVPDVPFPMLHDMVCEQQSPSIFSCRPLPNEIVDQIMGYLDKQDVICFMIAYYSVLKLQFYAPQLNAQMKYELLHATVDE